MTDVLPPALPPPSHFFFCSIFYHWLFEMITVCMRLNSVGQTMHGHGIDCYFDHLIQTEEALTHHPY